jgi:heat shock protein HslJ
MAAAGLVVLTGCGDESGPGGGSSDLGGKSYLSTAVTENGAPKKLAPNTRIKLDFKDDGTLSANAGCNSIGGQAATSGGKLTVEDLAVTDMGCDAPRHAQDTWLVELLQSGPTWKADADKLTITSGGTILQLQDRETAQPDVALDSTKWVLESVITGETASTPGNGGAYLTISGERVTGSTSCNELQGIVSRTGNKLTFGEIGTTRRACSGPAATLEKTVLATLNGEVTYTLDADKLQLRTPTKIGLDFKAAG